MSTVQIINITLQAWGILISILIGVCLYFIGRYRVYSGRAYLSMLALNTSSMLFDVMSLLLEGKPGSLVNGLMWFSNTAAFCCNALMLPAFVHYLLVIIQDRKPTVSHRLFFVACCISGLMLAALVVNHFHPFLYCIGPDNQYYRGSFHALCCICGVAGLLAAVILIAKHWKSLSVWDRATLICYTLIPLAAVPLQELYYGVAFITIGNTLSLTLIYLCFQVQQTQRIAQQENRLIEGRYTTALSQIQPHFMFNALNSIQYLCKTDPQKASQAISCFAKYLRVNMDSLSYTRPVPLSEDLSHLENYLYLQKIRFPDIIFEYRLETTDFLVPPLTLQPLVENAIRHGVRQLSEGGVITISSWEDNSAYYLQIKDNGGGFPEKPPEDGQPHLGITNTRTRIEQLCHGQMQVESQTGKGVTVQIRIPKEKYGILISG